MAVINQKLLSICIPTYNRADCLKRLLDNIIPQILESKEGVEICISNNASTDNTEKIVMIFKEKYPDLIKYNENEKNLGFDMNVLKVVNMAEGKFIWTFSDDDLIVKNGLKEVIGFIIENKDKKMGGMVVKYSSYMVDVRTGKRIEYQCSVDKDKPDRYGGLNCLEMLQDGNLYQGLPELIFNNKLLKKILRERQDLVKKGIDTHQFFTWLFLLLFLLNKEAKCYVLNKTMAISPDTMSKTKWMMEDQFMWTYKGRIQFFDNLLSIIDKSEKDIIRAIKKKLKGHPILSIIYATALYKSFGAANYTSYIKCIKLSFKYLTFVQAFFVSISLIIILIIPSPLVKKLCKFSMRFRQRTRGKIESMWLETCMVFASWRQRGGEGRTVKETTGEYDSSNIEI